ncbi:hypothetical protein IEO21_06667 [Rhodonia placenta]|uniref:Uncharacterized protein n=1 Tax=Rhodonia placenta TaxID=104341 RepID=A0A8H7NZT2_9APHY|nr:hypothetical protein IEO21_06667 [Postia placenta]
MQLCGAAQEQVDCMACRGAYMQCE